MEGINGELMIEFINEHPLISILIFLAVLKILEEVEDWVKRDRDKG